MVADKMHACNPFIFLAKPILKRNKKIKNDAPIKMHVPFLYFSCFWTHTHTRYVIYLPAVSDNRIIFTTVPRCNP